MKKTLTLPDTIEACHEMIISQARLIEQLQRRAFGGSLKDRAVKYEGPSLFEEYDKEAQLAAARQLEKTCREVDSAAEKRRREASGQASARGKRPDKYNVYGLPVETKTVYPEGIDLSEYDIIGKDETCVLHLEPQRLWVEKTITPVLRRKTDKEAPGPEIVQAPRPHSIIGGGHVGADLLATLIDNKFTHHLPEYRQVKMLAEHGLRLPTSTVNDWIHAVANVLYRFMKASVKPSCRADMCRLMKYRGTSPTARGRVAEKDMPGSSGMWAAGPEAPTSIITKEAGQEISRGRSFADIRA